MDEEIFLNLQSKNEKEAQNAFDKLYNKYYRLVYFVISKYLTTQEDKEDVCQDVFCKLYQSRKQIKNQDALKSYLSMIAKNTAINFAKKNYNRFEQIEDNNNIISDYNIISVPEFNNLLDVESKNVLILKIYYGYTFKEISLLISMDNNKVVTIYYKALKILKENYKNE